MDETSLGKKVSIVASGQEGLVTAVWLELGDNRQFRVRYFDANNRDCVSWYYAPELSVVE